jgi:tRNA-specific 2-thiouridylase
MSGGVDSSVAALLLREQGFDVHGVTLQVWEPEDDSIAVSKRWQERGCCKVGLARYVAQRLGLTHEVIDHRSSFRSHVIDDFLDGYLTGTTPNPCVRCNEKVKLRMLVELAALRGADYVATGHYARVVCEEGQYTLRRAFDAVKDQSYFLYRIDPAWLPKLLFPVGTMQKAEVWKRAEALGLPAEELRESQEICFVSRGDYRTFLRAERPASQKPGFFVDAEGRPLGQHEGIAYYTPGQRRGLGVAAGRRLYVQHVVPATNTVVLGPETALMRTDCELAELNLFDGTVGAQPIEATVKVRYATPPAAATVSSTPSGNLRVRFSTPQRALSPGQSAVLYGGDRVLGGGIIQALPASSLASPNPDVSAVAADVGAAECARCPSPRAE